MKTDEFGREFASEKRIESVFFRGLRVYLSGVAIGAGLCLGMGPPLPLINSISGAVNTVEQAPGNLAPRLWPDALLAPAIASISVQAEAFALLQDKWQVLNRALDQVENQRNGGR
jgi:hypothetical protein